MSGGGIQAVVGEKLGVFRVGRIYGKNPCRGCKATETLDPGADDLGHEVDVVVNMITAIQIESVTAAGGSSGSNLTVVEVATAFKIGEGLLAGAVCIGCTRQRTIFPDGVAIAIQASDPFHVAAIGAGGVVALFGEIVAITAVNDVFFVVLVDCHQGAFLAGDTGDDGATLLVTALFGRAADAALEGQALIALFEHHVDDTADGIGAIDG